MTENEIEAEIKRLKAEVHHWRTSYEMYRDSWQAIPTGALFDYWDGSIASSPDAKAAQDELGDWIEEIRRAVNVGRYLAGEQV